MSTVCNISVKQILKGSNERVDTVWVNQEELANTIIVELRKYIIFTELLTAIKCLKSEIHSKRSTNSWD